MVKRRPGRKRKAGARTFPASRPGGRLVQATARAGPTPELAGRRAALAGPHGDPVLTSCWLDVLLTRCLVDDEQHHAGRRYAYLRNVLYGVPAPASSTGEPDGRELVEISLAAMARDFGRLREALTDDPRARRAVDRLCLYDEPPRWLTLQLFRLERARPRPSDEHERLALVRGLDLLARTLGLKRAN